jgi:hypothetical protein
MSKLLKTVNQVNILNKFLTNLIFISVKYLDYKEASAYN